MLNESLKLRGGYVSHETPVPCETFEPSVPRSGRQGIFTIYTKRRKKRCDILNQFFISFNLAANGNRKGKKS